MLVVWHCYRNILLYNSCFGTDTKYTFMVVILAYSYKTYRFTVIVWVLQNTLYDSRLGSYKSIHLCQWFGIITKSPFILMVLDIVIKIYFYDNALGIVAKIYSM